MSVETQIGAGTSSAVAVTPNYGAGTGINNPPGSGGATAWSTVNGSLTRDDGLMSYDQIAGGEATEWMRATGFGFAIPANATITQVSVAVGLMVVALDVDSPPIVRIAGAKLIVNNSIQGDELRSGSPSVDDDGLLVPPQFLGGYGEGGLPPAIQEWVFEDTDWGLALTPTVVNQADFGFAIGFSNLAGEDPGRCYLDFIEITVEYELAPPVTTDVVILASISSPGASVVIKAALARYGQIDVAVRASIGFGIAVTTPGAGCPTVTTAGLQVAWQTPGVAQVGYRVQIFEDATAQTEIYDSGLLAGAQQSFTIPVGVLPSPASGLYLQVSVTNTDGVTVASDLVCFDTSFPTSVNVSGVTVELVGGCDDPVHLPGLRVRWSQVTEGPGETFQTYAVRKRVVGETSWLTVGEVTAIATTTFVDYNVAPLVRYEYSVVWRATSGASTLQSADTANPPQDQVDFDFNWIHTASLIGDSDFQWLRLESWEAETNVDQAIRFVQPWGRALPSAYVGQALGTQISVPLREALLSDRRRWARLREMVRLQRDRGAVMCLRFGRAKRIYYIAISGLSTSDRQKTAGMRLNCQEIYFDESIIDGVPSSSQQGGGYVDQGGAALGS